MNTRMNTRLHHLIELQQQRMRELRTDAQDMAAAVADEVWGRFESAIEDTTADGYMFDLASSTQMALASTLALDYDQAFERHVQGYFERQARELREAGAEGGKLNGSSIDLAGMRKGLKLRRHADDMIGAAIASAKPGLIGMIFLARDPCSEAWDKEHRDNARRLRAKLLELREQITAQIFEETAHVIRTARLSYVEMLNYFSNIACTQKTDQ